MAKEVKRFGDIVDRWEDISEWYKVTDILGEEIVIEDIKEVMGDYGQYALVKFSYEGKTDKYAFTTGAQVLRKKIMAAKEKGLLPLPGRIERVKRYYDIV